MHIHSVRSCMTIYCTCTITYVYIPAFVCVCVCAGQSSVGGSVVDLTHDSGVEDTEFVDLTSPVSYLHSWLVLLHLCMHMHSHCV